jgi:hypothetical protein
MTNQNVSLMDMNHKIKAKLKDTLGGRGHTANILSSFLHLFIFFNRILGIENRRA